MRTSYRRAIQKNPNLSRKYCDKISKALSRVLEYDLTDSEEKILNSIQDWGERTGKISRKQMSVIGALDHKYNSDADWNGWW